MYICKNCAEGFALQCYSLVAAAVQLNTETEHLRHAMLSSVCYDMHCGGMHSEEVNVVLLVCEHALRSHFLTS